MYRTLLMIVALALIVLLLLLTVVGIQRPQIERAAFNTLEVTARLKAQRVESWLAERYGDGNVVATDGELIGRVAAIQRRADAKQEAAILHRLDSLRDAYRYHAVFVLDPQGKLLLSRGAEHVISAQTRTLLPRVLASGEILQSDFYIDHSDGMLSLNFIVPLRKMVDGKPHAVGALVLHTEPEIHVFPQILAWPSASPSGETLLARSEGDSVVILSQVNRENNSSQKTRRSLSDVRLPTVMSIRTNQAGTMHGRDYRGVDVLAAYQPIAGTDWHLVAKLDVDEVMAPLWQLVWWVGAVAFAALVAIGVVLNLLWRQREKLQRLAATARETQSLRENEARWRKVLEASDQAVWDWDMPSGRVFLAPHWELLLGHVEREVSSVSDEWVKCVHPEDRPQAMQDMDRHLRGETACYELEYRMLHKNGSYVWVLNHGKVIEWDNDGNPVRMVGVVTDIGARKQQEVQVRQLLRENETILQNALVGIVYMKQRRIVSCNRRFEEIFQYAPGELIGVSSEQLYSDHESFPATGEQVYPMLGVARGYSGEVLLRHKDGSLFWGGFNGCAIDSDCPDEGSIFVCADITERRHAQQESEKLLQAVEQSPVSIVITNRRGVIEYVNPWFSRITGYTREEAIGQNPSILKTEHTTRDTHKDLWQTILGGKAWHGVLRNRCKNGELIWEDTTIAPIFNAAGDITHFVAVKEDVTEREQIKQQLEMHQSLLEVLVEERTAELNEALVTAKEVAAELRESEDRMADFFENVPTGVFISTREGRLVYVNPALPLILGYDSREELMALVNQASGAGFLYEEPSRRQAVLDSLGNGHSYWHASENRFRCKDGQIVDAILSIGEKHNSTSGETLLYGIITDITERKRAEAMLSEALESARQADRAKDEFLANITHELRTPLSAIIGFSGLALPGCGDGRQRDYLDKINSAGKTLSGLIDDLLDLSKIAAGRMDIDVSPFNLRVLVARCRSIISYKVEEKGLELVDKIDDEVPAILIGDSLRVEQILLNLLSNAVKFTAAGEVGLRVGLFDHEEDRVCLSIEVSDTGIGLREDEIAGLFKPFAQADASMARKFGGTGLGLAICKRLAELMEGDIDVTSCPGSGSTFCVRLWLAVGEVADLPAAVRETSAAVQMRYEDARVLIVDDQPFNREIAAGLLAAAGIESREACHGQEALEILSAGTEIFDLVLMDIRMPGMDGCMATQAARRLPGFAQLPIIAMTAHTMEREKAQSAAAGMNDHIGKPFDEETFYRILAKWISPGKQRLPASTDAPPAPATAVTATATANGLPSLRGIDTRAGLSLLQGDEARYRHWLSDFTVTTPAALAQIRQALTVEDAESASMTAHALKGRTGLLGMNELHLIAAALETAIEGAEPVDDLLCRLEQDVAAICTEIRAGLNLADTADSGQPGESLPQKRPSQRPSRPSGAMPASIMRLNAALQDGAGDCDILVISCLAELAETDWVHLLRQAQIHIQDFDYAAAARQLSDA